MKHDGRKFNNCFSYSRHIHVGRKLTVYMQDIYRVCKYENALNT